MKFFKNVSRLVTETPGGIASAVLFSSMFLAAGAEAAPKPISTSGSTSSSNVYASIQYYGDFFTNMGDFKGHENASGVVTSGFNGYDKTGNPTAYKPNYKTDYIAGGVSVGYSMGGPRIEIEGQYANIEVDDDGYTVKDDAKYLELMRNDNIAGLYVSGVKGGQAMDVDKTAFSITSKNKFVDKGVFNFTPEKPGQGTLLNPGENHLAAKFKNDGIRFVGGFVNFAYDVPVSNIPVSPFVAVGLGFGQTKFLGKEAYGLAYQAKAGIAYNISNDFSIFVAYDYRGSFTKEYKEVTLTTPINAVAKGYNYPASSTGEKDFIKDANLITSANSNAGNMLIAVDRNPDGKPNFTASYDIGTITNDKVTINGDPNTSLFNATNAPDGVYLAPQEAVVASTNATVETTFGVHGLMAGVTLKF